MKLHEFHLVSPLQIEEALASFHRDMRDDRSEHMAAGFESVLLAFAMLGLMTTDDTARWRGIVARCPGHGDEAPGSREFCQYCGQMNKAARQTARRKAKKA